MLIFAQVGTITSQHFFPSHSETKIHKFSLMILEHTGGGNTDSSDLGETLRLGTLVK